jgi:hypothetical protein
MTNSFDNPPTLLGLHTPLFRGGVGYRKRLVKLLLFVHSVDIFLAREK